MRDYVANKHKNNNYFSYNGISILIKDELKFDIDFQELYEVLDDIPSQYFTEIDYIMFGQFDFLNSRRFNASYYDGAIYVSNLQEDNFNVIDDIVHEVGHAVEEKYKNFLFSDGLIEKEFLKKRQLLSLELKKSGFSYVPSSITSTEYDEVLDQYFYDTIGYPILTSITQNIYYSPYASTSINEYFANGFEAFYYHRDIYLKTVSPVLFAKLENLEEKIQNV
mgnify:CR=1 FL=1